MEHRALGPIASHVAAVLDSFRRLAGHATTDDVRILLENEAVRFRMWTGNLAAHQSGRASLDHRLRDATHLQKQVLYLLDDLDGSLGDAMAMMSGEDPDPESPDPEDREDREDPDPPDYPRPHLSTICIDIQEAVDCLLRLSVAMANPAPHERFRRFGGASEDMSRFEVYDIRHVRDAFPQASEELATTLGRAITRRRQFFAYRKAHHDRLAAGLDDESRTETAVEIAPTEVVTTTVASSLPECLKTEDSTAPTPPSAIDEDQWSGSGITQTSYATSVAFTAPTGDVEGEDFKPPPLLRVPPRPAVQGTFECPFCYRMISATSSSSWKRHVFGDLRPYVCIFPGCPESGADFDRRHRWQFHVAKNHWRVWICPYQCSSQEFQTAEDLEVHLHDKHLPNATPERLCIVAALGEKAAPEDVSKCPLCGQALTGRKAYIKHVGRHFEQLALHALPSIDGDSEAEDASEDDHSSDEPEPLLGNLEQVQAIEKDFMNRILPQCQKFTDSPPEDPEERRKEYDRLVELISEQTKARLNEVNENGPDGSMNAKFWLNKTIQGTLFMMGSAR